MAGGLVVTGGLAVVGSANLDLVVGVERHPGVGETVLGGDVARHPGGKGANQAVAAARLGAPTAFVGCVGDDEAGQTLTASLIDAGVAVGELTVVGRPSGVAMITVQADGDNAIVVAPGANSALAAHHVDRAAVTEAAVVLLQLEVPIDTVAVAARNASGVVVLDPAPVPADPLPPQLLAQVDVIVPNQHELAVLAGTGAPNDFDEVVAAARSLGVGQVVVTLGAAGCAVVTATAAVHIPSPRVDVVDTTGSGDAFRAALAVGLLDRDGGSALLADDRLIEAARHAVVVGAMAATTPGAQPSMPTSAEVEQFLVATSEPSS